MSYTVLARRYRSQTFDDVVGQEAAAKTLKNAIATDRVAHAYLFTGTRGVGKTTMARILAKALNCLAGDGPTIEPCCECGSCRAINEGEDIDVLEIDGASNTGVEHIRELRQNTIYRPARARFKIYIIDEVHMLSVSAFNALLKTLEEPPEHVKFILATTEPNKVLATILSRCQRFDFRNISAEDIAAQLKNVLAGEKVSAENGLIRRVARLANGSMRDALSLLDQVLSMGDGELTTAMLNELLGTPRSERIVALAGAVLAGDVAEALRQVDRSLGEGLALEQLAETLQNYFRDVMILRNCGADSDLIDQDDESVRNDMPAHAKLVDDATLVYDITVMEELRRSIKSSGAGRPLLEAAVVRLTAGERFSDTIALLEQLQSPEMANGTVVGTQPNGPVGRQHVRHADRSTDGNHSNNSISPSGSDTIKNNTNTTSAPPAITSEPVPSSSASSAAGSAETSTPTDAELELPKKLSLGYLQEHWQTILTALTQHGGQHVAAYLKNSQPMKLDKEQLQLGYPHDGGMGNLLAQQKTKVQEIEKALAEVLDRTITLNVAEIETHHSRSPAQMPPGAKPSQKEIDAAIADKQVKQVQQLLGGKVRRVDRLEKK